jgi:hypothetical protein
VSRIAIYALLVKAGTRRWYCACIWDPPGDVEPDMLFDAWDPMGEPAERFAVYGPFPSRRAADQAAPVDDEEPLETIDVSDEQGAALVARARPAEDAPGRPAKVAGPPVPETAYEVAWSGRRETIRSTGLEIGPDDGALYLYATRELAERGREHLHTAFVDGRADLWSVDLRGVSAQRDDGLESDGFLPNSIEVPIALGPDRVTLVDGD